MKPIILLIALIVLSSCSPFYSKETSDIRTACDCKVPSFKTLPDSDLSNAFELVGPISDLLLILEFTNVPVKDHEREALRKHLKSQCRIKGDIAKSNQSTVFREETQALPNKICPLQFFRFQEHFQRNPKIFGFTGISFTTESPVIQSTVNVSNFSGLGELEFEIASNETHNYVERKYSQKGFYHRPSEDKPSGFKVIDRNYTQRPKGTEDIDLVKQSGAISIGSAYGNLVLEWSYSLDKTAASALLEKETFTCTLNGADVSVSETCQSIYDYRKYRDPI